MYNPFRSKKNKAKRNIKKLQKKVHTFKKPFTHKQRQQIIIPICHLLTHGVEMDTEPPKPEQLEQETDEELLDLLDYTMQQLKNAWQ